jgi:hypothetical protein
MIETETRVTTEIAAQPGLVMFQSVVENLTHQRAIPA